MILNNHTFSGLVYFLIFEKQRAQRIIVSVNAQKRCSQLIIKDWNLQCTNFPLYWEF